MSYTDKDLTILLVECLDKIEKLEQNLDALSTKIDKANNEMTNFNQQVFKAKSHISLSFQELDQRIKKGGD